LIDEKAEKYLWVDAATSSGVLGAVLVVHPVDYLLVQKCCCYLSEEHD